MTLIKTYWYSQNYNTIRSDWKVFKKPNTVHYTASAERPQTAASEVAILASGDESRLMEHEVTSPTEEVVGVRETIA